MKTIMNVDKISEYISQHNIDCVIPTFIISEMHLIKISKGEYLINQDSILSYIYMLVDGKLQVEHYELDGNRAVFSIETAFSVIGDLEVFDEQSGPTLSTVRALSNASLLVLSASFIRDKCINNPEFLIFICKHLCKKLRASSLLHSNASFSAEFKVRRYLNFKLESDGVYIRLEGRESLASMLGVSVRQLNRVLIKLTKQEVIELKNKDLLVVDKDSLSNISPSDF